MRKWQTERLTEAELYELFDRLFPHGFAGADVLAEIAPVGWHQSQFLACFHPPVERVFEEHLQIHRNVKRLRATRRRDGQITGAPLPEPTLDDMRRDYQPQPVRLDEEVTDLVGSCLWDVFSDNHDVISAGRLADIGSFRGAGAFLDEYLGRDNRNRREADYLRFYLGTIWISTRADLTPVYSMIFRRLKTVGAAWIYRFPELGVVDLTSLHEDSEERQTDYSVSEAAAAELKLEHRRAGVQRLQAEVGEINARARAEALDRPPPATVRAYRQVYGGDPRGWPPA